MYFILAIAYLPLVCHGFFNGRFGRPSCVSTSNLLDSPRNYPFSRYYYEKYLKRLNSRNITTQNSAMIEGDNYYRQAGYKKSSIQTPQTEENPFVPQNTTNPRGIRIILGANGLGLFTDERDDTDDSESFKKNGTPSNNKKSKHFEIVSDIPLNVRGRRIIYRTIYLDGEHQTVALTKHGVDL